MKFRNRLAAYAGIPLSLFLGLTLPAHAQHYDLTELTSDQAPATLTVKQDPHLINSWGLARSSTSAWWVSDNHSGFSTLYDGNGVPQQLVVTIPSATASAPAAPTGVIFNPTPSFEVAKGKAAIFVFATEDGTISGWNPRVNPTVAIPTVNIPGTAIYKGLAIANTSKGAFLYATNFKTGNVEMFDSRFQPVKLNPTAFRNPNLRDAVNWSAFGIQNVGGNIVVTFAKRQPGETDEEHGAGLGRVAIFDTDGRFLSELEPGPWMNAPWGIALSPSDFGAFSHRLLIGNFGSGNIHAFNAITGRHEGALLNEGGQPLFIDSIWALGFGSGKTGQLNELFFTSGPHDENDGLFGKLSPSSAEQRGNNE